jgi:hypothetical protein
MKTKKQKPAIPSKNSILLVTWHRRELTRLGNGSHERQYDEREIYSGLSCFISYHPEYNKETISHWITRRKQAYVSEHCTIEKLFIIRPAKK